MEVFVEGALEGGEVEDIREWEGIAEGGMEGPS